MRKAFSAIIGLVLMTAAHTSRCIEVTKEFSVQISAIVQESPAQITLTWPQDSSIRPDSYIVYRKAPDASSWGPGKTLSGDSVSYVDKNISVGTAYEYQVVKRTPRYSGYGYICAGIKAPMTEDRGRLLVVVDDTYATELATELARLRQDLTGDGWTVTRLDVKRNDSVASIKKRIRDQYNADRAKTKAVFLFGHIPVPYSGDIVPDGHAPDHQGAWPCDGFYGDMDGIWTDTQVNDTRAADARTRNVPGDGKFDQSSFPAPLKLVVGRVDLANMPGRLTWGGKPTFPSELELLRNYLNKDHKFRQKEFDLPRRAILGDYFGVRDGEAFAASGWRNLSTFFTPANVTSIDQKGTWISTLSTNACLWAYGCGPGSYTSIGGLGTTDKYDDGVTTEMVRSDVKAAFTCLFGSWLGDWDSEDNLQRAVLALPSYGLTCSLSGRPHWFMHHMALGETIGYSTRLTQNNGTGGMYQNQMNSCAGQIHIALMGDPTLRMHTVAPAKNVVRARNEKGVTLNWSASQDEVVGYHVYRSSNDNGPFTRLTPEPLTCTSYADESNGARSEISPYPTYMVRAVKLETSASGSYYNLSQGAFVQPSEKENQIVVTRISEPQTTAAKVVPASIVSTNLDSTHSLATNSIAATKPLTPTGGTAVTNDLVWIDDSLPSGSIGYADGGDAWNWVAANPVPFWGGKAHQSSASAGLHQHYFAWANNTMSVSIGDSLIAYVYLDPSSPPSEIMLQWFDGTTWEHRAYWGANNVAYGVNGTASSRYVGPLPAPGQWLRITVPASQVGLEGSTISGMAFTTYDGRTTWDYIGKSGLVITNTGSDSGSPGGTVNTNTMVNWFDDALPAGGIGYADGGDSWNWVSSNPTPNSGTLEHQSAASAGEHQHYFAWAGNTLSVNTGDSLFAYVYLDPNNPPSELMLQWFDGTTWEHRAYWGANTITFGTDGTFGRKYVGALPAAGQWALLQVPASQIGLEGSTLSGMAFTAFGGKVTWDNTGKAAGVITNLPASGSGTNSSPATNSIPPTTNNVPVTNSVPVTNTVPTGTNSTSLSSNALPGVSSVDYLNLELPNIGDNCLHILSPTLLELKLINTKLANASSVSQWNVVDGNGAFTTPASAFTVTVNGQNVAVAGVGFKRRPLFAPFEAYDLRIENSLYLQLASPISDNQTVQVTNPNGQLWTAPMQFAATSNPLRYSPAIHVNQEGYMPNNTKKAMVGYYAGNLGEMTIPNGAGFKIVDANTGAQVYQGSLTARPDSGWTTTPSPYQKVYEADFTGFNTPGEYRLVVPGMGGSVPFLIDPGIAMSFARGYALGLYHQRCGTNLALPYTRFTHDICHNAPASVPWPASSYNFTWTTIANYGAVANSDNPVQTAPLMTANSQLFPFVHQGAIDVSGGHHDAGDYSKYTENSANLIHILMFAADSLSGVGALDNLGIPESGDGISDVLQEAKWEADFIAKLQDSDGGFYFLVYPVNREYEGWVTPDHGDPQVVWPKTTSVTAASVAALAQCASSPAFKRAYPQTAAAYLAKAQLGWQFLMNAINRYGKTGAYQKITHYGDDFADQDELAWAACEMYLATGDQTIHQKLLSWFNPSDPATWRWGWWHLPECYGHCIRSYAFGARSGRVAASALDSTFLGKCQAEIAAAGDAILSFSQMSAYGTSFPDATKRVKAAGWYFSADQAFDIAVAYQLNQKQAYMDAMLANMNYEGGCNPLNVTFITGMGLKRQRDIVSQWHSVTPMRLPPTGIPEGNVTANFGYLYPYGGGLESLCYPSDSATSGMYPFYDRWGDSWNVTAEFTVQNSARGLATLAFLAAQSPLKSQAWRSVAGAISVPSTQAAPGSPIALTLTAPGIDLTGARIAWESSDQEPCFGGATFNYVPKNNGAQWVEAEAALPDGRRIFARATFTATSPNTVWVDDALPIGAVPSSDGGDSWNWITSNPSPNSGALASQSNIGSGEHQHFFYEATATLAVGTGDVLYAWVYLDPAHPPTEVALFWYDGSWSHGAYWGANSIGFGTDGTVSRRYMGPLPAVGQWVQLQVPASQAGLEGATLNGMAFTLFNGRATWDTAGRLSASAAPSSATVTVAPKANASRLTLDPGVFLISRSGDSSQTLAVNYSLGGTAANGSDYGVNTPVATIPAGSNSTTVTIMPIVNSNLVPAKTVVLTVASNSAYSLGSPATASISLAGNTVPVKSSRLTNLGMMLTWDSTPGKVYRIMYKNSLTAPTWTQAGPDLTATDITTSWVDLQAKLLRQRYYQIGQIK